MFFCLSAGGRGHYATGLQGAVLPHFFKQFLFWLCFCWRRRHQWHQRPPRCCDCVAAFFQTCFFCLSAGGIKRCSRSMCIQGAVLVLLQFYSSTNNLFLSACWRHHQCHRDPRCCVVAFLQTCSFLVFLLEESSAAAPPKRSKVLCCCISSTNSFFVFLLEASSSAAAADSSDSEAEARKIFHDQWNRQC